jgi:hypothetical protein
MLNPFRELRKHWLFYIIAALPPWIFLFHWYCKNAEYVDYWHISVLAAGLSAAGVFLCWAIARVGKSLHGSVLACVFLWIMFFTMMQLYSYLYYSILNQRSFRNIYLLIISAIAVILFITGRRIKRMEVFQILAVFTVVVFLLNFVPATAGYVSEKTVNLSETDYKLSFTVDSAGPSPNIYWIHADGMLGFKAVEHFFDDYQAEFESSLKERGFAVNREAEFEAGHATCNAIPALMCPFFYDKAMFPLIAGCSNLNEVRMALGRMLPMLSKARLNNELITAFNTKGYHTNIIGSLGGGLGYYFYPTTKSVYVKGGRIDYDIKNIETVEQFTRLYNINEFVSQLTFHILHKKIYRFISKASISRLNVTPLNKRYADTTEIYDNLDKEQISALSEIFENPRPRMTIIIYDRAHNPFVLTEEGLRVNRTEKEGLDIRNYPPQHRFTARYLISLIDFILDNDPDAIIVAQADHGLHDPSTQNQVLSSGGTMDDVGLVYNQVMSAVRIPDKWGGLDAPPDPLNITRLLVNRYVGQNYELLESHP